MAASSLRLVQTLYLPHDQSIDCNKIGKQISRLKASTESKCLGVQVPWWSDELVRMTVSHAGEAGLHHLDKGAALLGGGSAQNGPRWCLRSLAVVGKSVVEQLGKLGLV